MKESDEMQLVEIATRAMKSSYAPYSRFNVGAALLTQEGEVFCGCNVENAAFGCTNCAERTALFKAVSEGRRVFSAIAIVGGREGKIESFCPPCGMCRQVLSEFCDKDFCVVLTDGTGKHKCITLGELLPQSFSLKDDSK